MAFRARNSGAINEEPIPEYRDISSKKRNVESYSGLRLEWEVTVVLSALLSGYA
jgi:hypothetical protein